MSTDGKEATQESGSRQIVAEGTHGVTGWIVLVITLTLIALGILAYLPASSNQLSLLFAQTSFSQLWQNTLKEFGVNGVVVGLGGFFALAAFFTAIPSSGGFAGQGTRISGLFFLQQTAYWPVILILLISPYSVFALIPLVLPPAVGMELARRLIKDDLQFSELTQSKSGQLTPTMTLSVHRFIGAPALTLITIAELYYMIKFNPSLPLFGWLLVFYLLFFVVLQIAYTHGLLFQAINAKNVSVIMNNGDSIEGYLTSKGEDHILMRTEDQSVLIPMSSIQKIRLIEKKESPTSDSESKDRTDDSNKSQQTLS